MDAIASTTSSSSSSSDSESEGSALIVLEIVALVLTFLVVLFFTIKIILQIPKINQVVDFTSSSILFFIIALLYSLLRFVWCFLSILVDVSLYETTLTLRVSFDHVAVCALLGAVSLTLTNWRTVFHQNHIAGIGFMEFKRLLLIGNIVYDISFILATIMTNLGSFSSDTALRLVFIIFQASACFILVVVCVLLLCAIVIRSKEFFQMKEQNALTDLYKILTVLLVFILTILSRIWYIFYYDFVAQTKSLFFIVYFAELVTISLCAYVVITTCVLQWMSKQIQYEYLKQDEEYQQEYHHLIKKESSQTTALSFVPGTSFYETDLYSAEDDPHSGTSILSVSDDFGLAYSPSVFSPHEVYSHRGVRPVGSYVDTVSLGRSPNISVNFDI